MLRFIPRVAMASTTERPVCGLCRLLWHPKRDDQWNEGPFVDDQRDREYDHLCADCYPVIVESEPETRDWILDRYPVNDSAEACG